MLNQNGVKFYAFGRRDPPLNVPLCDRGRIHSIAARLL
jgi:hypothetical protein